MAGGPNPNYPAAMAALSPESWFRMSGTPSGFTIDDAGGSGAGHFLYVADPTLWQWGRPALVPNSDGSAAKVSENGYLYPDESSGYQWLTSTDFTAATVYRYVPGESVWGRTDPDGSFGGIEFPTFMYRTEGSSGFAALAVQAPSDWTGNDTDTIRLARYSGSSPTGEIWSSRIQSARLRDGNPHQLVLTVSGSTAEVWVDGTKAITADIGAPLSWGSWLTGCTNDTFDRADGEYDEIAFWPRVLTDTEVLTLWTPTPTVAPPARIFPRDDGLGVGAARRFPPPKSQQRSSRRFGYY